MVTILMQIVDAANKFSVRSVPSKSLVEGDVKEANYFFCLLLLRYSRHFVEILFTFFILYTLCVLEWLFRDG